MKNLKATKQCKLGAQCGRSCISKAKTCKVNLTGTQKTSVKKAVEKLQKPKAKPVEFLGAGAFGEVNLNNDGSVTKTYKDQDLSYQVDSKTIAREAKYQKIAAKAGVAPKVLSYDKESITMERAKGAFGDFNTKPEPTSLRAALLSLHKSGLAHNDIHGGNVAFDGKKTTLIDFGLASKDPADLYREYYQHVRKDNKLDTTVFSGETYLAWLKTQ